MFINLFVCLTVVYLTTLAVSQLIASRDWMIMSGKDVEECPILGYNPAFAWRS
jgi:hypothetical protein